MFNMFEYKSKAIFTLCGIFDSEFSAAAGTCTIMADSLEAEECAVVIHGMNDGSVVVGGKMFPELIDWKEIPSRVKERIPKIKKIYLVSCFDGMRNSECIDGIELIIPNQLHVKRPIGISRVKKKKNGYAISATASKFFLATSSITGFFFGISAYKDTLGIKGAAKEMFKVFKMVWKDYILAD